MIPKSNIGWLPVILLFFVATAVYATPNPSVSPNPSVISSDKAQPTGETESIGETKSIGNTESLLGATGQGLAADNQGVADNPIPEFSEMVLPSMTRIGFSLLLIVGFIYGLVFLMRKFSGNRFGGTSRGKNIHLIEQTFLAPKKSICLLKLGERAVLVGITDSNVNFLTEFNWDELPEPETAGLADPGKRFSGFLADAAGRMFKSSKGVVTGAGDDKGVGHAKS